LAALLHHNRVGRAFDRGALPELYRAGVRANVYPVSTQGRNPEIPKLERMSGFGVSSEKSNFYRREET